MWSAQRENNCGNQVAKIVGKGGERKYELWQPSCRKWEEKKNLWQPSCQNLAEEFKKKMWQLIYGNGIAKMEGEKKFVAIDLWHFI